MSESAFDLAVSVRPTVCSRAAVRALLAICLAVFLGSLIACAADQPAGSSGPTLVDGIKERGSLIMLSFPHQESVFVRTNLEMGPTPELGSADHFVGIDVDIMQGFAERLGVDLQIRRVSRPEYGALIPDLLEGKADLIASSFTITDERRTEVDFTDPYFWVYPVIVTRRDRNIAGVEDLEGLTAAAIPGSSHEEHLLAIGVPPERITHVSFTQECFSEVAEGAVDMTLHDSNSALRYLRHTPELKIAFRLPGEDGYGFAVRPGETALLEELNAYLAEIKSSGLLAEIVRRHIPAIDDLDTSLGQEAETAATQDTAPSPPKDAESADKAAMQ